VSRARVALAAGLLLLGSATAWALGIAYWEIRARKAVRFLRERHLSGAGVSVETGDEFRLLGCRALPALVAELDAARPAGYLCRVEHLLNDAAGGAAPRAVFETDPESRARDAARLRDWHRREGGKVHQAWRFWSSRCAGGD
jgi:hypothetical protein